MLLTVRVAAATIDATAGCPASVSAVTSQVCVVACAQLPRSGAWLAYSLDLKGDEAFKLYVRNVTYGVSKAAKSATYGPIPNVAGGGVQWANDNFTFFCITQVGCGRAGLLLAWLWGQMISCPYEGVL